MYKCEFCGREYKTRSGLRRHVKAKHPPDLPLPLWVDEAVQASELYGNHAYWLERACQDLGIKASDILAYKVYHDRVVIIEGPVGYERVWMREDA
jgi:hypothetical protein